MTVHPNNACASLVDGENLFTAAALERRQEREERSMSRRTDPGTSRAAAKRANRDGTLRGHRLAIVRALATLEPGEDATAPEIARIVNTRGLSDRPLDQVKVCRRLPELVSRGVALATGSRECREYGSAMRAYTLSASQRSALEGEC